MAAKIRFLKILNVLVVVVLKFDLSRRQPHIDSNQPINNIHALV